MLEENNSLDGLTNLREALMLRANMTDEDMMQVFEKATFKEYNKGDLIISEGKVENYLYFVVEGMARTFFYKEEKETSLDFFFAGGFFSSYESFLERKPSRLNIEALTPLITMRMNYNALQELYVKNPKLQQIGRIITEELFRRLSERVQDLLSLSASERYQKLLEAQPEYVQHIPLKYLASYLNVTPESLSRIRKGVL
jgi:CRP-like cAMP-binding protein